jgi:signal transduction histidine kinase
MLARLKVRTKLIAVLLPLLLGVGVLATLGVTDRLDRQWGAERTRQLVATARAGSEVVHRLQAERLLATALQTGYAPAASSFDQAKIETDRATAALRALLPDLSGVSASIGNLTPAQARTNIENQLAAIDKARNVYDPRIGNPQAVSDAYSAIIDALGGMGAQLMLSAVDLEGAGVSVHWLAAAKEADARSGANATAIISATTAGVLPEASWALSEVPQLRDSAASFTTVFVTDATEFGRQVFDEVLADQRFVSSQAAFNTLAQVDPSIGFAADMEEWIALAAGRVDALRTGEQRIFDLELAAADARVSDLQREVRLYLGGSATALLLALLLAAAVTRSITGSLNRLTRAARTISTEQLPRLVDSLQDPDVEWSFQPTRIDVSSEDEFGELAAAFNAVEQTAIDVATEQSATLRKGIGEIFVNLARRNQSLLDRQIEFIDRLEANEEDPDQLENLFKLDHLATRMRRNAESLLVLAGAEAPRKRAKEVSITDVIRVAVGEVEDFARITLLAVDEAMAVGSAAVDIAHLLSELMENGTQYSPPDRRVEVVGHRTNDGGYVISVSDQGVGMTETALAEANHLLAHPPVIGLSLSRSLGFIVVATLARRHGISVKLTDSPSGGLTAIVTLPPELLVHAPSHPSPPSPSEAFPTEEHPPTEEHRGQPLTTWTEPAVTTPVWEADAPIAPPSPWEHPTPVDAAASFGLEVDPFAAFSPQSSHDELQPEPVQDVSAPSGDDELAVQGESQTSAMGDESLGDVAPMGVAFEQGIFSLLDAESSGPPAEFSEEPTRRTVWESPQVPGDTPTVSAEPAPEHGLPPWSEPAWEAAPAVKSDHWSAPAPTAIPVAEPAPPLIEGLPRRQPTQHAAAEVTTSRPDPLPRRRRNSVGSLQAEPVERLSAPTRPPEEIRNILSRYRSGLQTGRAEQASGDPVTATNNEHQ